MGQFMCLLFILLQMQVEKEVGVKTEWTAEENLAQANILKEKGNSYFKSKQYKEALRAYHKAILHLAGIIDKSSSMAMYTSKVVSQDIKKQCNQLKFTIYLNMSQIYINQAKYDRGVDMYPKIYVDSRKLKFYFRRAYCLMKLSEFQKAKSDIITFIDLDPNMKSQGEKMLNQMAGLQREQDKKSKKMYQKFFK